jgi:hypothetical protein
MAFLLCWGMRRNDRAHIARVTCACHLDWQVAERCDHDVVKAIAQCQELDAIYTLNYISLFSEFFAYLRMIGLWEPLAALMPEDKQRWMIAALPLVLVYVQQHIAGLPSLNAVEEVLLTDETAMRMAGFNARQIHAGICRRGRHRRRAAEPPGRPVCADTLARNVCAIDPAAFTALFNTAVRCLAAQRMFPARVTLALDPTDIETSARFGGAGSVTRRKKLRGRTGRMTTVETRVYGFRLIVVMETSTRIPVAAKLVQIQENGIAHWRELISQARANLAGYATVDTIVADREFVDGEIMWWVQEQGMGFVMPGKNRMDVVNEARQRMRQARAGTFTSGAHRQERQVARPRGQGRRQRMETVATIVWGIEDLAGLDSYAPADEQAPRYRRDARGHALNAVVVEQWNGTHCPAGEETVFLTNRPVHEALRVFDTYDDRSLIETCVNKEAKQNWHLGRAPQRTRRAMHIHVFTVLMLMGVTRAFRAYQKQLANDPHQREKSDPLGFRRWRQRVLYENADKVIVFVGQQYGILSLTEFCVLIGGRVRIRGAPSRAAVLARYGVTDADTGANA